MNASLDGKVAVVTGASRGIGSQLHFDYLNKESDL